MELGKHFNQTGDENSFKTTEDFVIAFIGAGEQYVYFNTYTYAGFANVDPNHNDFIRTDTPDEMKDRMIHRIVKGFTAGVLEASGIDTLESAADVFMAATGIVIVGGLCVVFPSVFRKTKYEY